MLENLTAETFLPFLDADFELHLGDGTPLQLRLREIGRYAPSGAGSRAQPFSLLFEAPRPQPLPQHIYRIEHPAVGVLEIFLVPVGRTPEGVRYEAVFN